MTGPSRIYLIRHAEKPDSDADIHLSAAGYKRAGLTLVRLFGPGGRYAGAQYLMAADNSKHSHRSVETLEPLSNWLHEDVDHHFSDDEYKDLAKRLRTGKKYDGATILVCWHHGSIPALAKALGVRAADLPVKVWPDDCFDRVWIIDFGSGAPPIRSEVQS